MNRILVTGGAGFIGSNFVHYWVRNHGADELTVLDALTYAGNLQSIAKLISIGSLEFVHGNICDENLVSNILETRKINTIIHFAAESHVDRSILGPDAFIHTNIVGTYTLLNCARKIWLSNTEFLNNHRFHHVSTDEVYGSLSADDDPFTESTPYKPSSPYSASKAASDMLVRSFQHTYGMNITISNCSNNYGAYHFPEKLIPLTIINILEGRKIPVYGNGMNIRDWLYVEDHCLGIDLILGKGVSGETYNIGGNCEIMNIDVVKTVCDTVDEILHDTPQLLRKYPHTPVTNDTSSNSLITYVKDRPGHDLRYAMNTDRITTQLGFRTSESFQSGIYKTIHWYLSNDTWWKPIINQDYQKWLEEQYG